MRLLRRYTAWFDRFRLLFRNPTPNVTAHVADADKFVRRWVERPDAWDHTIPSTTDLARQRAEQELTAFDDLLGVAEHAGTPAPKLVPDTNALLRDPDLASYAREAATPTFDVHVVTTVLRELDDLKDRGRTPELRDKAQAVVRRFKGLRDKGSLSEGVSLTKNTKVFFESREVPVADVLSWLDPSVPDDRILGAALRLQSDNPSSTVLLVTSDLNLQNKADAAGLPYMETPSPTEQLRAKVAASISWRDDSPFVTLVNEGPAGARDVTYAVETDPGAGRPSSRSGPWTLPRLDVGATDERQLWLFFTQEMVVTASWTDDDGPHERSWKVPLPERPGSPRATRTHRGR